MNSCFKYIKFIYLALTIACSGIAFADESAHENANREKDIRQVAGNGMINAKEFCRSWVEMTDLEINNQQQELDARLANFDRGVKEAREKLDEAVLKISKELADSISPETRKLLSDYDRWCQGIDAVNRSDRQRTPKPENTPEQVFDVFDSDGRDVCEFNPAFNPGLKLTRDIFDGLVEDAGKIGFSFKEDSLICDETFISAIKKRFPFINELSLHFKEDGQIWVEGKAAIQSYQPQITRVPIDISSVVRVQDHKIGRAINDQTYQYHRNRVPGVGTIHTLESNETYVHCKIILDREKHVKPEKTVIEVPATKDEIKSSEAGGIGANPGVGSTPAEKTLVPLEMVNPVK